MGKIKLHSEGMTLEGDAYVMNDLYATSIRSPDVSEQSNGAHLSIDVYIYVLIEPLHGETCRKRHFESNQRRKFR